MPEADAENREGMPVGEFLRSVRESRGLELEQASRVTKIGKNYLAAIEEGHFEKLPNAAYIKGFLRLYAGFLSIPGDEVIERYERTVPPASRPQSEPKPQRAGVEIMERAKLGGHGRWAIPALLLALVVLAAVFLSETEQQQVRPTPPPAQAPPAAIPIPAAAAVQPQRSSAAPVTGAAPAPAEPPSAALPPGEKPKEGIILRLRFNRDSWLGITIDDSISQRYDLKAGDVIEWKGARAFVLDLGDGGAVEAEFNGRPLKALGEAGKPAHVELKGE